MPPKTKDKKGGKSEKSLQTKVNPYTIEVTQALTAVGLLDSPEEPIVFLSTCTLDTFVTTYGKSALLYLQELDFLGKLFRNLKRCQQIRMICLKLIAKLLDLEDILDKIQKTDAYIDTLINVFMTTNNEIEIEYTSHLLSHICVKEKCAQFLCKEDIVTQIFNLLVRSMDLDIKNNCLQMLLRIVKCNSMKQKVSELSSLNIGILNLVLSGPFTVLRPITVQIFNIISAWHYPAFQKKFLETETLSYLLEILLDEKWTNLQNDTLNSILNCLKYNPVQVSFIESKNFLKFCKIAREFGPEHALACVALIHDLILVTPNRQVMLELCFHDHLHEYCKFDDDLVAVKFCETLALFCKNCHVISALANANVLREIERLMRKTELPWIPYRQAGIHPLFLMLMNNPRVGILYFKSNIIKHILAALQFKNEIEELNYKMVIEMFQTMLCSKCLHVYLWTKEIYELFIKLLTDSNPELVKMAIDIVQRTFYSQEYREWFLEMGGVESICKMIVKRDCDYIHATISFCKIAAKYRHICLAFMRGGLIPAIQDLGSHAVRQKQICDSIVEDIYKCELSIKFHDLWFLDYHDITDNGFYFYVGYKPRIFPPEEVNDMSKFSFTSTIISVNFHGKRREKTLAALAVHDSPKSVSNGSAGASSGSWGQTESTELLVPEESEENIEKPKFIYKLSLPIPDSDPATDFHLKSYLKRIKLILNHKHNNSNTNKIVTLAKFVVSCLTGYEASVPQKHQYETHIMELKKKFQSNYIPLGSIRMGGMIERAVLFKVLADRLSIPCSLRRTSDFSAWNEVIIYTQKPACLSSNLRYNFVQECVVDLLEDVGALLLKGQQNTELYCQRSELYAHAFEVDLGFLDSATDSSSNDYF